MLALPATQRLVNVRTRFAAAVFEAFGWLPCLRSSDWAPIGVAIKHRTSGCYIVEFFVVVAAGFVVVVVKLSCR